MPEAGVVLPKFVKDLLVLLAKVVVVVVLPLATEFCMGRKNRKSRKPQRVKRQETNNMKMRAEYEARQRHPSNHKRPQGAYRPLAVKTYELWDD